MRFKAKLAPEQVALLYQLVVPISKLSGSGVENSNNNSNSWMTRNGSLLRLDDSHLQLFSAGRTQDSDGIKCFAELATAGFASIFLDKVIESAAPQNAIVMEIDLVQLRMALKSILGEKGSSSSSSDLQAPGSSQTVLKLAKRNNIPCLCLDAVTAGATIQVHHAIPVRIRKYQEMQVPPQHAVPDIQLELLSNDSSSVAALKTIVEKLKHMSPVLYLEANAVGELTVSTYQDGASIQAFFSKLKLRRTADNHANDDTNKASARVKMDTKKLWASLSGLQQQSHISQAVLCLVENEMVVLHISLHSVGFFTYYVPVHFLNEEGEEE